MLSTSRTLRRGVARAAAVLVAIVGLSACTPEASVWFWFGDPNQGGTPDMHRWASRVVACESGWNPSARNPSSSASGLFQIMGGWAGKFEQVTGVSYSVGWDEPFLNAMFARWLYDHGGPSHWVCR